MGAVRQVHRKEIYVDYKSHHLTAAHNCTIARNHRLPMPAKEHYTTLVTFMCSSLSDLLMLGCYNFYSAMFFGYISMWEGRMTTNMATFPAPKGVTQLPPTSASLGSNAGGHHCISGQICIAHSAGWTLCESWNSSHVGCHPRFPQSARAIHDDVTW